jgi:hypothetical protein
MMAIRKRGFRTVPGEIMSDIQLKSEFDTAIKVINALMTGEVVTAGQIAEKFSIPFLDVVKIINNPEFIKHFSSIQKSLATVEFDAVKYRRMMSILTKGADRDAIQAFNALENVLGPQKGKDGSRTTLEVLIRNMSPEKQEIIDVVAERVFPGVDND